MIEALITRTPQILQHARSRVTCRFVHYAQSSAAKNAQDSSVSYAAGVVTLADA